MIDTRQELPPREKQTAIGFAREIIARKLGKGRKPDFDAADAAVSDVAKATEQTPDQVLKAAAAETAKQG